MGILWRGEFEYVWWIWRFVGGILIILIIYGESNKGMI